MQTPGSFGSKGVQFNTTFSIFFFMLPVLLSAQIGLRLPEAWSPVAPLDKPSADIRFSMGDSLSQLGPYYPNVFRHSVTLDSTRETVTVSYRFRETDILQPQRVPLDKYLQFRHQNDMRKQWREYAVLHLNKSAADQRRGGIKIETPKIKSKAFESIFGGNTMSLNVNGEITIDGNMRNEKRSQVKTALNRGANTNFEMKQTQRFKVTGKIGENLSVQIDQDSERAFDFENNMKLHYSSDEDGIIESIEAGNVSLSLPGTQFITFSSHNAGLFGFKAKMKIGALDITTIASMEKGEKKKLSLAGGAEDKAYQIQDYEYKKGTYFFVDQEYRNQFSILEEGEHTYVADRVIKHFELYKYNSAFVNDAEGITAWATLNGNTSHPDTLEKDDKRSFFGSFKRLDPSSDYYLHPQLGYFMLNSYVSDSEVLAVAYRDSSQKVVGDLLLNANEITNNKIFKLIRPRNPQPSDPTWDLEWKNVYSLGGRNISEEGFELNIFFKPPSGDPREALTIDGKAVGFLEVFGLDKYDKNGNLGPDNIVDMDPNIISLARGELIFPELQPFNPGPGNPFYNALHSQNLLTSAIYDTLNDTYIRRESKFYMEVRSSSRSPNFSLGLNVIEGSEEVTLNGQLLMKETDYVIDYFSGQLTMLNEAALNPNANLDISYESQKLFQVDKKSIMGARAEYTLWEKEGSRSFIGGTLLYMNQKTLDQRVRVGQDAPMSNFVWGVNTSFNFEPRIVDQALDAAPFLRNSGRSSFSFEGELAQIIPNPNTLNSDKTGDHDGVAYLDDFEGSRREVMFSVMFNSWHMASIPDGKDFSDRGHLYWYNPYEQVPIQEIWPDREVTTNYGGTTRLHVLDMVFTPNPGIVDPTQSWYGVTQALSTGYFNQTDSRFLEVWVKGDRGRLHVNLGRVSEDAIPNGRLDTEDKRVGGFRNGVLDDDEDVGLDGVQGKDPPYLFYPHEDAYISNGTAFPYDFWDLNGNGVKEPNEPWSYDDWQYTERGGDYRWINGTENSKNATVARYPDTEDLNGNGDVDFANDYFEYSFSLDKSSQDTRYIAAGGVNHPNGWALYRIPLAEYNRAVGNPEWNSIEFVRIWVDGVEPDRSGGENDFAHIRIAEIKLTGNEWKLRGVAADDHAEFMPSESTLNVSVINTHDNPEYTPPPGVEGDIDPIQKIRTKEQSLVLTFDGLHPGETAIAEKQFYEPQNLLNYKSMKMFVHGGSISGFLSEEDSVSFFLRWGSDTNNENYYEVMIPHVRSGWDEANNIWVEFQDLSRIKLEQQALPTDTVNHIRVHSEEQPNGHVLRIVGEPSLTNVRWLIVGLKNNGRIDFSDEIWLNELRLSNVRKDKGMAYRAKMDIRLGDVLSVNGSIQQKDADFHTVNERFGQGTSSRSTSFNASVNLDKFMPTSWGFSIPVSGTYSESNSMPKFLPGSDIEVNETTIDRSTQKGDSLWKAIQNISERKGLSVSLSKRTKSRNFLVKYLLDPVRTSFSYSSSHSSNSSTKFNTTTGLTGSASYNLTFGTQNYLQPLKWMGQGKLVKNLADLKFYYLPKSLKFDVKANDSEKDSQARSGIVSRDTTRNYSQSFSLGYDPLDAFTTSYNRNQDSDMRYATWSEVLESLEPGNPTSVTQGLNLGFNPRLTSWFSPNFKYTVSYGWKNNLAMQQRGTGTSCNNNISFTASGNLDLNKMMRSFQGGGGSRSTRVQTPARRRTPSVQDANPDAPKEEEKDNPPFFALKLFSFGGALLGRIEPISMSFSNGKRSNFNGIQGTPSMRYQFGLSDSIGVSISPNVTTPSTSGDNLTWSLRSGVKISNSMTLKLDYNYTESETRSTQITGSSSRSALLIDGDAIPFPNWTFNWRSLEKLPYVDKVFKSLALSHGFSGKKSTTITGGEITAFTTAKDFRPLVNLTYTLKMNVNGSIQFQTTESLQQNLTSASKTRQTSDNISISARYQKRGGLKLPFMKGKLDNNIDFSLTFSSAKNASSSTKNAAQQADGEEIWVETSKTSNWSFKPTMSYEFSRTVRGGVNFELGKREDMRSGSTEIKAFGINARISLN